jgi:hypothetical protein
MPEEFGTVNVRRGERAREIEVIRQHYRHHREALTNLVAEAPTEHLAGEYNRLIQEIDLALGKLGELEGRPSEPGLKPLVTTPPLRDHGFTPSRMPGDETSAAPTPARLILIIAAGVLVLAVIGWLMWRASVDERPVTPIVTETAPVTNTEPITPAPAPTALAMEPPVHDFGTIRKGTRAARQFEVANNTDQPVSINIARSACRCLYYDYANVVPPNGRETITVTLDGAKAPAGALQESIAVSARRDPSVATSFLVKATIR